MVDRNKVDDIMEMMKSDPVFEELFSSFGKLQSIMMIHYMCIINTRETGCFAGGRSDAAFAERNIGSRGPQNITLVPEV